MHHASHQHKLNDRKEQEGTLSFLKPPPCEAMDAIMARFDRRLLVFKGKVLLSDGSSVRYDPVPSRTYLVYERPGHTAWWEGLIFKTKTTCEDNNLFPGPDCLLRGWLYGANDGTDLWLGNESGTDRWQRDTLWHSPDKPHICLEHTDAWQRIGTYPYNPQHRAADHGDPPWQ